MVVVVVVLVVEKEEERRVMRMYMLLLLTKRRNKDVVKCIQKEGEDEMDEEEWLALTRTVVVLQQRGE